MIHCYYKRKSILCIAMASTLMLTISSCRKTSQIITTAPNPIVTVNGETLYKKDLDKVLSHKSGKDSIEAAHNYINQWINDRLIYAKAKENLEDNKKLNKLVDEYKKTLMINEYQEQLVGEKVEKTISESEIKDFYQQNKEHLKLDESIIKGLYLKIPKQSTELKHFREWYKLSNDDAVEKIEKKTLQNTVNYDYFYDKWVSLSDVMNNIPYTITDEASFLKTKKFLDIEDSSYVYLLNIKEYQLEGNIAPYEYIKPFLKGIVLEKKKADYLKKVQKNFYQSALSDGDIKFYN